MSEDIANIIFGYMGLILCGTFSIGNKLNTNEAVELAVILPYLDLLRYTRHPPTHIKIHTKLLY